MYKSRIPHIECLWAVPSDGFTSSISDCSYSQYLRHVNTNGLATVAQSIPVPFRSLYLSRTFLLTIFRVFTAVSRGMIKPIMLPIRSRHGPKPCLRRHRHTYLGSSMFNDHCSGNHQNSPLQGQMMQLLRLLVQTSANGKLKRYRVIPTPIKHLQLTEINHIRICCMTFNWTVSVGWGEWVWVIKNWTCVSFDALDAIHITLHICAPFRDPRFRRRADCVSLQSCLFDGGISAECARSVCLFFFWWLKRTVDSDHYHLTDRSYFQERRERVVRKAVKKIQECEYEHRTTQTSYFTEVLRTPSAIKINLYTTVYIYTYTWATAKKNECMLDLNPIAPPWTRREAQLRTLTALQPPSVHFFSTKTKT